MPLTFNQVKTNIPGVGYRAYLFSTYMQSGGGNCVINPYPLAQCHYFPGEGLIGSNAGQPVSQDTWQLGGALHGLNDLAIGSYVTVKVVSTQAIVCHKVIGIIDEATFNSTTCTICPPGSGCPNPPGCSYGNTNYVGIGLLYWNLPYLGSPGFPYQNGVQYLAYNVNNCDDCILNIPYVSSFEPNMVVNCCEPTEIYQIGGMDLTWITGATSTTSAIPIGVTNTTQAFRANFLNPGGVPTGYKCWTLKEQHPPFGPTVHSITIDPIQKYPDCGHLNNAITVGNQYPPCCGTPPPVFEPNMIINCCDPTERYNLDPTLPNPNPSLPPIYEQLTVPAPNGWPVVGQPIVNYQEAFVANLYIDGGVGWITGPGLVPPSTPKCWHLANVSTPVGPTALSASIMNLGKYPSCGDLGLVYSCCTQGVSLVTCPPPYTKLANLTSKLDTFRTWKNKALKFK